MPPLRHVFFSLVLIGITIVGIRMGGAVGEGLEPALNLPLPKDLLGWTGTPVRFCHAGPCRFLDQPPEGVCHSCGEALHEMTHAEAVVLPADTTFEKVMYESEDGLRIDTGMTLSGKDRSSIHRPEVCVAGGGFEIVYQRTVEVEILGQPPLQLRVLDLSRKVGGREQHHYFAYWFVGADRETASHWERIWWMSSDRLFRNVSHRWAYLHLQGERNPADESHLDTIKTFVTSWAKQLRRPLSGAAAVDRS